MFARQSLRDHPAFDQLTEMRATNGKDGCLQHILLKKPSRGVLAVSCKTTCRIRIDNVFWLPVDDNATVFRWSLRRGNLLRQTRETHLRFANHRIPTLVPMRERS